MYKGVKFHMCYLKVCICRFAGLMLDGMEGNDRRRWQGDAARLDSVKKKINGNVEKKWDRQRGNLNVDEAETRVDEIKNEGRERKTAAGYGTEEFAETTAKD